MYVIFDKLNWIENWITIEPSHILFLILRNEFAYSSSDKMVYIRKFSTNGVDMVLLNTLQGHFGEVTAVKWNDVKEKWVTGSEDGTIRIWVS